MKYSSNNTQFCCSHSEYVQLACDFVNKSFDKFILHAKMSGKTNKIRLIIYNLSLKMLF